MAAMSSARVGIVSAEVLLVAICGAAPARADGPSAGDACSQIHASTRDDEGRTMWCNRTMTGDHALVWQYTDSGDD